jgi:hypothetical protein
MAIGSLHLPAFRSPLDTQHTTDTEEKEKEQRREAYITKHTIA